MSQRIYWLDANVFIQARNGPCSFQRVPQFWVFLSGQLEQGIIRCPKMVYDEMINGNDDLAAWFKPRRERGLFKPHQASEFLIGADGWLIAHAMNGDGIVVTQESNRSHKSKIKIPTLCRVFGVRSMDTYRMLDALGADLA